MLTEMKSMMTHLSIRVLKATRRSNKSLSRYLFNRSKHLLNK